MSDTRQNLKRELVRRRAQRNRKGKRIQQQDANAMVSSEDESIDFGTTSEQQPVVVDSQSELEGSGDVVQLDFNDPQIPNIDPINITSSSNDNGDRNQLTEMSHDSRIQKSRTHDTNVNSQLGFYSAEINSSDGDSDDGESGENSDDKECSANSDDELRLASVTEEDVEDLEGICDDNYAEEELLRMLALEDIAIPDTRLDKLLAILRRRLMPSLPKCSNVGFVVVSEGRNKSTT